MNLITSKLTEMSLLKGNHATGKCLEKELVFVNQATSKLNLDISEIQSHGMQKDVDLTARSC